MERDDVYTTMYFIVLSTLVHEEPHTQKEEISQNCTYR